MKVVLALLCGLCFFCTILSANSTISENNTTKPLLQGMKPDSESLKFPFETGKSPLESVNMLQYFGVILILVGLLLFLWYVKNRLNAPQIKSSKANVLGALFDKGDLQSVVQVQSVTTLGFNSKLVIFEAYNRRYLVVLSPNDATLLDSYNVELLESGAQEFKELLEQEIPSEAK
ncbi:hypothetical protein [uncultured Helicobacter sp.]|uniref:hypothetical protein n=1 Tax=uncultured Helicobacter sp. TaxID=175537 RepID=UPI00262CED87|nr:hypothetical protein [uncultured Helicobacter sp.]